MPSAILRNERVSALEQELVDVLKDTSVSCPTVTVVLALLPPAVALIVAVPRLTPFTTPWLVTVATAVLDEVHVTAASTACPSLSRGEAESVTVCPTPTVTEDVLRASVATEAPPLAPLSQAARPTSRSDTAQKCFVFNCLK